MQSFVYETFHLNTAMQPHANIVKCIFLSARYPSVYQNDPTIHHLQAPDSSVSGLGERNSTKVLLVIIIIPKKPKVGKINKICFSFSLFFSDKRDRKRGKALPITIFSMDSNLQTESKSNDQSL